MKYLKATTKTQGQRNSDYCFTKEGELLVPGFTCESGHKDIDDGTCGCKRGLAGISSNKATTTFIVDEKESENSILSKLTKYFELNWCSNAEEAKNMADDALAQISSVARPYPVGTILEKRESGIQKRRKRL